jgi:hypothetical protein
MSTQPLPKDTSLSSLVANIPALDYFCRSLLFKKFRELKHGQVQIEDQTFGDPESSLKIRIVVHRSRFYSRTLLGGSISSACLSLIETFFKALIMASEVSFNLSRNISMGFVRIRLRVHAKTSALTMISVTIFSNYS